MMRASSSADHLLCFLAGDSVAWGAMMRLAGTPKPGPGSRRGAAYTGGPMGTEEAVAATVVGTEAAR